MSKHVFQLLNPIFSYIHFIQFFLKENFFGLSNLRKETPLMFQKFVFFSIEFFQTLEAR